MNNRKDNEDLVNRRRLLPFFIEFIRFSIIFAVIVVVALLALNVTSAAMN